MVAVSVILSVAFTVAFEISKPRVVALTLKLPAVMFAPFRLTRPPSRDISPVPAFRMVRLPEPLPTFRTTLLEALAVLTAILPLLVVMLTPAPILTVALLLVFPPNRLTFSAPLDDVMFLLTVIFPSANRVRVASVPFVLLMAAFTVMLPLPAALLLVVMLTLVPLFSRLLMLVTPTCPVVALASGVKTLVLLVVLLVTLVLVPLSTIVISAGSSSHSPPRPVAAEAST